VGANGQQDARVTWGFERVLLSFILLIWIFVGIVTFVSPSESYAQDGYSPHVWPYVIGGFIFLCAPGMAFLRRWAAVGMAAMGLMSIALFLWQAVFGKALAPYPVGMPVGLFIVVILFSAYPVFFAVRHWKRFK
jgi:hypothetical protein